MNQFNPKIDDDVVISPFDSSSAEQKYLLRKGSRHFKISEAASKIISLMDGMNSVDDISCKLNESLNGVYSKAHIEGLIEQFLLPNEIIKQHRDNNAKSAPKKKKIKNDPAYLHLKFTLFSSEFVSHFSIPCRVMFRRYIAITMLVLLVVSDIIFAMSHNIDLNILNRITLTKFLQSYFIFTVGILLHELGHASAARYLKIRHNDIGIGVYLIFIVFFTNVSYTWSLKRRERLIINLGGIYFQAVYIVLLEALLLFFNIDFVAYAVIFIHFAIIASLNPFVKFDGYWILSDLLGIGNLSKVMKEYLIYVFKRIINSSYKNPVVDINKKEKRIFYCYFFITVLIWGYFLTYFIYKLPLIIYDNILLLKSVYLKLASGTGNVFELLVQVVQTICRLIFILFFILYAVFVNLKRVARLEECQKKDKLS